MKKYSSLISISIVCFILSITFCSCSNNNSEGRYIPSTAAMAVQVNFQSLTTKLPWSEIKKNTVLSEAYTNGSSWVKNFLDSPAISGIDIDKGLVFFVQPENNGGYIALEGSIKEEVAFKKFCSQMGNDAEATEDNGIQYISSYPACVGWNSSRFIYIIDAPEMRRNDALNRRMQQDSIDITDHNKRDITAACKQLFNLSEKNSLAADDKFTAILKEEGDLRIWANTELFYKDVQLPGPLQLLNLEKFYKESITTAAINFENGKIKLKAHSFSNAALSRIFEKFAGGTINEELLKKIYGSEVTAALCVNFKPEALQEIAKVTNLDGIINRLSLSLGFTTADFIKANKGDIALGITDFKMVPDSTPSEEIFGSFVMYKPSFNVSFAAAVADKPSFDKLVTSGNKIAGTFLNTTEMPVYSAYNNNYFVLSNTKEAAAAYLTNTTTANKAFISNISGAPVGGYVNLQALVKAGNQKTDSSTQKIADASLQLWDNAFLKGGDFNNGSLNYSIEINLVDKKSNSLQQLNSYLALITGISAQQRKKELEDMRAAQDAFPVDSIHGIK